MTPAEQTEARRADIAHRMRQDIFKRFPLLEVSVVNEIVDDAMFQIEHLLTEIEGLRRGKRKWLPWT